MRSTPVSAMARTVCRLTPPEASSRMPGAMAVAAAATNCVFFEEAPAGSCLAGVEDRARKPCDSFNVLAGKAGDAAEALQEVQCGPLGREKLLAVAIDNGQTVSRLDGCT